MMKNFSFKKLQSPDLLQKIRNNPHYTPLLNLLKENYTKYDFEVIPSLTYSMRMTHDRVGTREEFELPYFERRYFLASCTILSLLYPENEVYLAKLQDMLWAILDEWSWAGCSHTRAEKFNAETFIDLFAAETGLMLTEISILLQDRLEELVLQRIQKEVKRRIVESYNSRRFWWEWATNNWTMVCTGNVACILLYLYPEIFEQNKERIFFSVNNFLDAAPDDGTCLEGLDYWHYGFENFVWFADNYYIYTDKKVDLLNNKKVEKFAGYPNRILLKHNTFASIADSLFDGKVDIGLNHFLISRFPNGVTPLPSKTLTFRKGNVGWHELSKNLLYFNPDILPNNTEPQGDYYFQQAGQAVVNKEKYSLFAKAGHNDEPHNHNDVGSFILSTNCGQVFCDLGSGRYVDAYFQPTTRYETLCNSSLGHSLPIIDNCVQKAGREFCGELTKADNIISINFRQAYQLENMDKLQRTFDCQDEHILLMDEFSSSYDVFVERFVTTIEPKLLDGFALVGNVKLFYDKDCAVPTFSVTQHIFHNGIPPHGQTPCPDMSTTPKEIPVYLIDFKLKSNLTKITFKLLVEK